MNSIRTALSICVARLVRFGLRILGKGATTLPGRAALGIQPSLLRSLSENRDIITITGTNGKTTTTHMISEALTDMGYAVVTNVSGANMATGIATSMVEGVSIEKKSLREGKPVVYVLEVDEASFAKIAKWLAPKIQVVTNLFRDQLDRYGEITQIRNYIEKGIEETSGRLLLNADDSMVASLSLGREDRTTFWGMDAEIMRSNTVTNGDKQMSQENNSDAAYCIRCQGKYEYRARSYGHFGDFFCPSCGFERQKPEFSFSFSGSFYDEKTARELRPSDAGFSVNLRFGGESHSVRTTVPGVHNFYNLIAATAACTFLGEIREDPGLSFCRICSAMEKTKPAFGRMEKIRAGDKELCLLLVKNPVGLERTLAFLSEVSDAGAAFFLLNSNDADGRDISWIWDVDFEARKYPEHVFVSGERYGDMLLRLIYAGVDRENITYAPLEDCGKLVEQALQCCKPGECLYILPNYTSMLCLRKILEDKYNLQAFWK